MTNDGRSWPGLWVTWLAGLAGTVVALGAPAVALLWLAMASNGISQGGFFPCHDQACVNEAWLIGLGAVASVVITGDGSGLLLMPMAVVLALLGLGSELRLRARGGRGALVAFFG